MGDLGEPFAPLPAPLLSQSKPRSKIEARSPGALVFQGESLRRGRDSKPSEERPQTSPEIAPNLDKTAAVAIVACRMQATVSAGSERPKPEPADPDEALRAAIVAALYASDFDRVKALVGVLESTRKKAAVLDLASHRPKW